MLLHDTSYLTTRVVGRHQEYWPSWWPRQWLCSHSPGSRQGCPSSGSSPASSWTPLGGEGERERIKWVQLISTVLYLPKPVETTESKNMITLVQKVCNRIPVCPKIQCTIAIGRISLSYMFDTLNHTLMTISVLYLLHNEGMQWKVLIKKCKYYQQRSWSSCLWRWLCSYRDPGVPADV